MVVQNELPPGGSKDLFRGLAIERLDQREHWDAHPVIRLDLSKFKGTEEAELTEKFDRIFLPYEKAYGIAKHAEPSGVHLDDLICGITASELDEGMAEDVAYLAERLGIPNAEVAEGLYGALLPACSGRPASDTTAFVADFTDAVAYSEEARTIDEDWVIREA